MNEREIFQAALDYTHAAQRREFLDRACGTDDALRTRVEALLAAHGDASQFLNQPAVAGDATLMLAETPGDEKNDDSDNELGHDSDLSFLKPSTKPGSIGVLGHYEILQILGQGAFGTVFKAFDEKLQRHVAIKTMNVQMAATSPPRKRFLREARAAAAIRHDNVTQVYSVEEEPIPYLVMEYIDGVTLHSKLNHIGPLDIPQMLHLGKQIALGLAAAHEKGLVHRDIKPGNILLEKGAEQKVKITDFGLARAADDASLTQSGLIAGTPLYMAPEQAMGQALDARTDLFSFGSVLYQMASGHSPFRAPTMVAVLRRVVDDTPRPLREMIPETPVWFEAIVNKLLAKKADDRFQSAKELADLLGRCQSELQSSGHVTAANGLISPTSTAEKSPSPTAPAVSVPPRDSQAPPSPPGVNARGAGQKRWLLGGGVVALVLLGALAILLNQNGNQTKIEVPGDSQVAVTTKQDKAPAVATTGWHGWPADAPKPAIAPFDAAQAKKHQDEWAAYLKLPVEYENSMHMKFALIPPGEFTMGSTPAEIEAALKDVGEDKHWQECIKSEAPQHKVILTQAIYLGVNEVTQKEYEQVMGATRAGFSATGQWKEMVAGLETNDHPVEHVSWNDAAEFCAKLSQKEELKPFYFRAGETITPLDGAGYRLPTEAEWEFACRAGTTTKYWSGDKDDELVRASWFRGNSGGRTHAAGELKANPLGLYDVHGNVSEWVEDGWDPTYYGQFAERPAIDPNSPSSAGAQRVIRGGHWDHAASYCRSATRHADHPTGRNGGTGFRVSLVADAVKELLKRPGVGVSRTDNPVRPGSSSKMPDRIVRPTNEAAPPSSEPPIDFAAERKVAERLLRLAKGTVTLGNKDRQPIGELKEPLPVEPFCILSVDFTNADLTDDHLAVLVGCRAIETLELSGQQKLTSAGLTQLGPLPFLNYLEIRDSGIGDGAIAKLTNYPSLVRLQALTVPGSITPLPISEAGWESLPPCPRLRLLNTSWQVGDAGLRRIVEQCPELRDLTLWYGSNFDPTSLAGLTRLTRLHTGSQILSEAGIDTLLKLPVLDQLSIDSPDQAGLERLRRLQPKLTHLNLRELNVRLPTSDAWKAATEMHGLLVLTLGINIPVDGPALQRVAAMPNLRRFEVSHNDISDPAKFRTFTAADVAAFRQSRPDVLLEIGGQTYPALSDWPGKFEGSTRIAEWTELPPGSPAPAVGTFSAEVAQQKQAEWAEHLKTEPEITNSVGMKFRFIPPGEMVFNITPPTDPLSSGAPPDPRLALQRIMPYYLGSTEVTVGQFKQFVEATKYVTTAERLKQAETWKTPGYALTDDLPVNIVSPADAQAFCDWLNESSPVAPRQESRTKSDSNAPVEPNDKQTVNSPRPSFRGAKGLHRLPTELEWELATRAGGAGEYGFAGTAQGVLDYAWTNENVAGKPTPVQPVATKRANPFGLHDVLGNVWEWYTNADGGVRGVAGNGYENGGGDLAIHRRALGTHFLQSNVGFRVLRQLEASPAPKFAEQPVLTARNAPLGPQVAVTRPAAIPGVRSWTVELAAHQSYVRAIAWSPKGDVIATTSNDMTVRLWDREGNLKSILLGHAGSAGASGHTLAFSPDGTQLATVDMSTDSVRPSTLRIWDVGTGACQAVVPLRTWGWCVAWSPDGTKIAYGGTNGMCDILDLANGQTHSLKIAAEPESLAWSADSQTLCVPEKGLAVLFDMATSERLATLTDPNAKPDEPLANRVAWSPDGRWLAGAAGKQVRIWDATTREHVRTLATEIEPGTLHWDHSSQRLAIAGHGGSRPIILDATTGNVVPADQSVGVTYDVAWSPDGAELVAYTNRLQFLEGQTGKLLRSGTERGQSHLNPHQPTFLSPDGHRVQFKHGERLEFDAESGELLEHRKAPNGAWVATAPDERWRAFFVGETDVVIEPKRFDHDPVTITTPGSSWVWRSDPSGERIAQAFDQQVRIWDAATGQPLGTLEHPAKLWSFEWSPDGTQLATAADDKTIRLWDTRTNKLTAEFKQFPQELSPGYYELGAPILAWRPDGRSLWIPLGLHAGLLDLSTGRVAAVENYSNGHAVGSLTLASDGDRLLAREGYSWTFLRERDGSRQLLGQFLGLRPNWHPDSRRFLSGSDYFGGVRGYDVATQRRLGTLWPVLTENHWLCVGPTGHYRGSPGVEEHIVYVAQLDDGTHLTLSPTDFASRFPWKNDPEKATLLKLDGE